MSTQEGNLTPQADDTVASLPLEEAIACSQVHDSSVSSPVKKKSTNRKKRIIERAVDAAQMSEYIMDQEVFIKIDRCVHACTLACFRDSFCSDVICCTFLCTPVFVCLLCFCYSIKSGWSGIRTRSTGRPGNTARKNCSPASSH